MNHPVDRPALDRLLRSCVECGLCLPHCATYLETGNEAWSPRGRLLLLREVLDGNVAAGEAAVRETFDHCLGCLACTGTCPSGVSADLLAHARTLAADRARPSGRRAVVLLDRRPVLRLLRVAGGLARTVLRAVLGAGWRRRLGDGAAPLARLARLLGTLPAGPGSDRSLRRRLDRLAAGRPEPTVAPHSEGAAATGPRVAIFRGCADESLMPATARRLRELLDGLGCQVTVPAGQDCCGALAAHVEKPRRVQQLQTRNRLAFASDLARCDHVVVAASGCGQELASGSGDLAGRVIDAVTLLDRLQPDGFGAVPLRVAVHDPCHARHGLGVIDAPRRLLRRIPGLVVLDPAEAEVCCGSAGVYGIRHPELSAAMGRRKAQMLAATGCDLVVTTNPGCLGQIADGLALTHPDVPIIPLSDLVWYAWRKGRRGGRS